jgi:hypothetical protein
LEGEVSKLGDMERLTRSHSDLQSNVTRLTSEVNDLKRQLNLSV